MENSESKLDESFVFAYDTFIEQLNRISNIKEERYHTHNQTESPMTPGSDRIQRDVGTDSNVKKTDEPVDKTGNYGGFRHILSTALITATTTMLILMHADGVEIGRHR